MFRHKKWQPWYAKERNKKYMAYCTIWQRRHSALYSTVTRQWYHGVQRRALSMVWYGIARYGMYCALLVTRQWYAKQSIRNGKA